MNRLRLVDECKALIREAYEEATEMIVAYLETHPGEPRQTLCREIDPDNYHALDQRVARLQEKRRSEGSSTSSSTGESLSDQAAKRHARRVLKDPAKAAAVLADPEVRRAVEMEIASSPESTVRVMEEARRRRPAAPSRSSVSDGDETISIIEEVTRAVGDLADLIGQAAVRVDNDETLRDWSIGTAQRLRLYADTLDPKSVEAGR